MDTCELCCDLLYTTTPALVAGIVYLFFAYRSEAKRRVRDLKEIIHSGKEDK